MSPDGNPPGSDGGNAGKGGNGRTPAAGSRLTESQMVEALEHGHAFPEFFPVVVIAKKGTGFATALDDAVSQAQGDDPYEISERPSRAGTYVSYRVELYVHSARDAIARRQTISEIDGVLFLL
jgi:putative lipoic acid-binding regulatory protein